MPMIPLLIGAGMGLLNASEKDKQASEDRKVAAATIAYSPYTGASIDKAQSSIHPAQYAASMGAGALAGVASQQGNAAGALNGGVNMTQNAAPQQMADMQSAYKQISANAARSPQAAADMMNPAPLTAYSPSGSPQSPYWRAMNSFGGS